MSLPKRNLAARRGSLLDHLLHCLRSNSSIEFAAACSSSSSRVLRKFNKARVIESSAGPKRLVHSCITWTSLNSPRLRKRALPAFFICFQAGSGSIAIIPSARDRQRRRATRKSCTGSGSRLCLARSHSCKTLSIQTERPAFSRTTLTRESETAGTTALGAILDQEHCRCTTNIIPLCR